MPVDVLGSKIKKSVLYASAGGAALCVALPAYAQLDEIIITSERREQSLYDVPVSISAVSGTALDAAKVTRSIQLAEIVPNLQINRNRLGEQRVVLRGIGGAAGDNIAQNQAVALFIDDVFASRGASIDLAFFDLDRVEVLRGPQGTLYGKNAVGGAINIYSKLPDEEARAKASIDFGNFGTINSRALVSGQVAEEVFAKVSFGNNYHDGFVDNLTTGNDMTVEESYFGRAVLRYAPDIYEVILTADIEHHPENAASASRVSGPAPFSVPGFTPPTTAPSDFHDTRLSNDGVEAQDVWGASAKIIRNGSNLEATSISGFRSTENTFFRDIDQSPIDAINQRADEDSWLFSQEFRLSSVDGGSASLDGRLFWTLGFYAFHEEGFREEVTDVFGGAASGTLRMDLAANSLAAYGQATYSVTDEINLTGGLRYTYEEKKALHNAFDAPILVAAPYANVPISDSWNDVSPKVTVDYAPTDDVLLYATYSKGFLSGGFNFGPATVAAVQTNVFEPEDATNYEVGLKGSFFDNRLGVTAAVYWIDYQDLQVQSVDVGSGVTTSDNAAEATIKGFELESQLALFDATNIGVGYAYNDAEYDAYCVGGSDSALTGAACLASAPGAVDAQGNRLSYTPKHSFNVKLDHTVDFDRVGSLIFTGIYAYQTETFFSPENDFVQGNEAYGLLNANLSFITMDDQWQIGLWGRNLTDKEYKGDCNGFAGVFEQSAWCFSAPPRTYGVSLTWDYNG